MVSTTFNSYLHTVDADSAALMLQLQLEDINCLFNASKGKARVGEVSDQEVALQLCQEDIEASMGILQDRQMSQSIIHAQQTDRHILSELAEQEELAANDRNLAYRLDGRRPEPKPSDCRPSQEEPVDEVDGAARLKGLCREILCGRSRFCNFGRPNA
ncbi:hypothetical protein IWX90DRAFT_496837 [Phyllosticta citrichinensis]|uniref:Uncharacterized protein n=1 Tax=Phyllosticta citrichinensis TaxID=1130410 RepID=A0ABR1Y212_9PEZI